MDIPTPGRRSHSALVSYLWLALLLFASLLFALPARGVDALSPTVLADGDLVEVIIILRAQPLQVVAPEVQAAYEPALERIRHRLRTATDRPALIGLGEATERLGAEQDPARALSAELRTTLEAMRREELGRARPQVEASQAQLVRWLESVGAEVHGRLVAVNAVVAAVPQSQLAALWQRPEVAEVADNQQMAAQLDHSHYAIDADTWHAQGYKGGTWIPAILDTGVRSLHNELDHIDWTHRLCPAGGRPPDTTTSDVNGHGTNAAGIILNEEGLPSFPFTGRWGIAPDRSTDAISLKAAYDTDGLDGGDAVMNWSDMMTCADWALVDAASPGADAFQLGYSSCADPGSDDSAAARFWDAVVSNLSVPAVIAAGNWNGVPGSCTRFVGDPGIAYNVISVGNIDDTEDATASSPGRSNDTIHVGSAVGPTPGGRRKPDLVAPGTFIATTDNNHNSAWASVTGTSEAAAHVTGALLLLADYGITDPRLQKALLIATASDYGDPGWDPEYGWGYIDLDAAWSEKANLVQDTISPAPGFQLYKVDDARAWDAGNRAVLVWNRQVSYAGAVAPATAHTLNNLDLYLYDQANNSGLMSDTDVDDNVHMVRTPPGDSDDRSVVIKVDAVSPSFAGAAAETYALASQRHFVAATGPAFTLNVVTSQERCVGERFSVPVTTTQSGDLVAHAVNLSIQLPAGLTLVSGSNPVSLGQMQPGASVRSTWDLRLNASGSHPATVRATSVSYGETFTKAVTITVAEVPVPAAPTRSEPADGAVTCDATPFFNWSDVTGATGYQIQVDNDANFSSPVLEPATTRSDYTPENALATGLYYWRVRASYRCGYGPWSATVGSVTVIQTPATPSRLLPEWESLTCDTTPTFDWADADMASTYRIRVDDSDGFSSPAINASTSESTYTPGAALALGLYYWQVRASNQCGDSSYSSPPWTFQVIGVPGVPSLQSPANGNSTCDTTPTFDWSDVAMASGYAIQVDNNSDFSSPEIDQSTSSSDYTPALGLPAGTYYWRVRATNQCGESSFSSSPRTLTVVVLLDAPTLQVPDDASSTCDTTPTFDWGNVTGATSYRLEVDNTAGFGSPEINVTPSSSQYTPASALAAGTYYWRVLTRNMCGEGEWSPVRSVTVVVLPGGVSLVSPGDGAESCVRTPTFDWSNATGASDYQIMVDEDSTYGSAEVNATPTDSVYTPVVELAGGIQYWRVRSHNLCGYGPWSESRIVKIVLPLPAPGLTSPVSGGVVCTATPTYDWSDVAQAVGYRIQVDEDDTFNEPRTTDTTTTASQYTSQTSLALGMTYHWRVLSRTSCGDGPWSASRSFTRITVPDTPSLNGPADGTISCNATPTFSWTVSANATGYRIEVDNDESFGSPVVQTTTTDGEYTVAPPLPAGLYYWRVRALNTCGNGNWSPVRTYTVNAVVAAPALLLPANGSSACNARPDFDWSTVSGASGYRIQVATRQNFNSPILDARSATSNYTPMDGLAAGLYYWRVLSANECGDGLWSSSWTMTVLTTPAAPGVPSPAPGSAICSTRPSFDWSDSAEATGYRIEVSQNNVFSPTVRNATTTVSSYSPETSLELGPYFWHVLAAGTCGEGTWSPTWPFTITTVPGSPSLSSPDPLQSVCQNAVAFRWAATSGATSYRIRIDDDPAFLSPAIDAGAALPAYTPTLALDLGSYNWQVLASNNCGSGVWSASRLFTVVTGAPAPALESPSDGSSTCSGTPVFEWPDVAGATGYRIQVDNDSDFSSPVVYTATLDSIYVPVSPLPAGTLYWRVLSRNACGDGAWSPARSFSVLAPPPSPLLIAPANGSGTCDTTPSFDWESVAGAADYWIVVDDDPTFRTPELMSTEIVSAFTPSTPLAPGRYYWRVRPRWTCGEGAWSATWTLIVGVFPPALQAPENGLRTCDTTPSFDWADVPGATSYRIQADNNINFASPEVDATTVSSGYTVSTPLAAFTYYWRVRSSNACGNSAWSPTWTVTVGIPPVAPGAVGPADGSATCDSTPTFAWTEVSGATSYRIQIDDDLDWSSPAFDATVGAASFTPPSSLAADTYRWRVRSVGECGEGNWSPARSLTILAQPAPPGALAPASGTRTCDTTPAFDWADAPMASAYRIQVDNDADMLSPELNLRIPDSFYETTDPLSPGRYHWRVLSANMCGEGEWSAPATLSLITVPAPPSLESPAEGAAACDGRPTLDWTDVIEATGYQIQLDDDPAFLSPEVDNTSGGSSVDVADALEEGEYHWRVRGSNQCGPGAWSPARGLVVGAPALTLLAPPDGSRVTNPRPSFDWADGIGAEAYRIQVDGDPAFGSPEIDSEILPAVSQFAPVSPLPAGWYSWRVRARTACGDSLWAGPWLVRVAPRIYLPLVVRGD